MGDTYIEEMVARKKSIVPTALYVILGAVGVGSIIMGMLGATLFYSIALFAGLGIYFVHYLTGVEYEYLYVAVPDPELIYLKDAEGQGWIMSVHRYNDQNASLQHTLEVA